MGFYHARGVRGSLQRKGSKVSRAFIDNVYRAFSEGNHIVVLPEAFDGRYADSFHGFGFFPRLASLAQVELLQTLEVVGNDGRKSVSRNWKESVKSLEQGFLFFGGDFQTELRISGDVFAWSYFVVANGACCPGQHGLLKDECIGVLTDDGTFVIQGPLSVVQENPRQFAGFVDRMGRIREMIPQILREIVHEGRPRAVQRALGTDFRPGAAVPHDDPIVVQDPRELDYTSFVARRLG